MCVRSDTGSQTKTELFSLFCAPTPKTTFIHYSQLNTVLSCPVCSLIYYSSQTGKSSSNILPGTSFKPGNYLTILSTLSFHYIHIFYYRLALYVHQKLCILFYFVCLSYSSIILIKLAIKIKKYGLGNTRKVGYRKSRFAVLVLFHVGACN